MSNCADHAPFALQVLGDSMEPEFSEGMIVIVEPGSNVSSGCYVVAQHEGEYLLRQFVLADARCLLKPLNVSYPTLALESMQAIRGRVIQRAGKRRKDHKSYI